MSQIQLRLDELISFAEKFLTARPGSVVLGLSGELGAGKTTFVRAVVEVLARRSNAAMPKVASPTYTFHQSFALARPVEHFDLYRLEKASRLTLIELGYYDALTRARAKNGLVFVEWPTQVEKPEFLELDETLEIKILPDARLFSFGV